MLRRKNQTTKAVRGRCQAMTKADGPCTAPAVERGLCFFHAHPEKTAELGREGGRRNRHVTTELVELRRLHFKSVTDVSELLEDTINQLRAGRIDPRISNAVGFLAGILLKALEQGRVEERLSHVEAVLGSSCGARTDAFEFTFAKEKKHE